MSKGTSLNLQGVVYKITMKPPKLDEEGNVIDQDLEIVLRVPLGDGMRTKLADLSRLQNGQTAHFKLQNTQFDLDLDKHPAKKTSPKDTKQPPVGTPAH